MRPGPVLGYINELPPESAATRAARHGIVATRRAGLPIIVHRGVSRLAPENTLEAYAAALDCGADGIEIDIRRSRDGVLYIFHDDTLERLANATGPVAPLTYYELLRVTPKEVYGSATRDTRPPTLAAVLALARDRAALLHLDIKEAGIENDVAAMLTQADVWDHVVEVNNYNADRIRADPRLRLMSYKGWLPEGGPESADPTAIRTFPDPTAIRTFPDPTAIHTFLDDARRQHQMVICDDPRPAAAALGRVPAEPRAVPPRLRAWWTPTRAKCCGAGG
ncbi:MAG: glycerophosphodiester phosphodiesterase family protein [Planctomycetota bacterium]